MAPTWMMAMVKRVAGVRRRRQWGWRKGQGHLRYDWREGNDGGDGPWFVCVLVCVERPKKIRKNGISYHECAIHRAYRAGLAILVILATRYMLKLGSVLSPQREREYCPLGRTTMRSCYEIRVLWYLLMVLTYQSHLITHQS